MPQRFTIIFILVVINGCSAIDYSALREQTYYQKTVREIRQIESQERSDLESQPFFAGVSKVQILTPDGISLAGFGSRRAKQSTSVHDPVYVRALAVTADNKRVVIVSADLLAISNEIYETVLKKVNQAIPLAPQQLSNTG